MSADAATRPPPLAYNLVAILLVTALLGLGAAYIFESVARQWRGGPDLMALDDRVTVNLAGRELAIPRTWLRDPQMSTDGFAEDVELALTIRDANGAHLPVSVTLQPRSRVRSSAALLDSLYLHLFEPGQLAGVPGLVGKPLKASEGYAGETVWYDALSPAPFVAKCSAPLVDEPAGQCLRSVALNSGTAAVYRFDSRLLGNWRNFDAEMSRWLAVIGSAPGQ
jgi:hypothetical protein